MLETPKDTENELINLLERVLNAHAIASVDPVDVVISERQAVRIFLTNVDKQDIRRQDVTVQGEELLSRKTRSIT